MPAPFRDPESALPLTPATFHILLALADEERHGYAIMQEVAERTEGGVKMGPGTLYGSLKRLVEQGLVEESDERADPALDDERRRYYRITRYGLAVARAEARRLEGLVRSARQKKLIGRATA
jgi:DNA-binding PadR family transcriptional regulator